jgi:cytidylate kinase
MPVVTISGQPGTAAHDIGRLTAKRLGIDYVDQEILVEAARTLGVSMESVVAMDERTSSLGERVANMLRRFLERSAAAGASDPMLGTPGSLDIVLSRTYAEAAADESAEELSDDRYIAALTGLVRDVAAHNNVVIIGRGSQVILKEYPGVLHALLVAPLQHRIESLAAREGLSREAATKREHDGSKGRAAFHQKFFKVDVDKPALYHLVMNTARLSPDEVAEMIAAAVPIVAAKQPV